MKKNDIILSIEYKPAFASGYSRYNVNIPEFLSFENDLGSLRVALVGFKPNSDGLVLEVKSFVSTENWDYHTQATPITLNNFFSKAVRLNTWGPKGTIQGYEPNCYQPWIVCSPRMV